uniref:S1 motif domain-containing protein n=2 Tax=Proboscia inermis TaxID=420281 RepID=A0A7S0CIZ7_9STRA|mmetsp:Transcript_8068/g.9449  ORF Transcript_8068/g.9449 Transcript_8068/m.9449 type:complete len:416 (+) Transcript_8068:238-1485(+)|eukprot:CAMPEP_0194379482 /NCGR_PEP_ID=MMETSP0174-20130528/40064_1 /TAXON_ID=216777 /ORGANISM="Proboscia alata, Strain PI-D3" /LENGTH=415 /DNA_ID=CAMNT_0039162251 /DNA_START=181 /DNA_END=1428 /DNA_ORIENTATION=+
MKITNFAVAVLTAGFTSAFQTSQISRPTFLLKSTVVDEVDSMAAAMGEEAPEHGPTRFDTYKKKYSGYRTAVEIDEGEDSISYEDFDAAVTKSTYSMNRNDVVKGTVVQYDKGGAVVDIGAKSSAFLPVAESALIQPAGSNIETLVNLDDEVDVQIISEEDENGQLLVSVRRIQYRAAWDTIAARQALDGIFEAEVVDVNRGGAICLVEGLRAFLPGSHLTGMLATEELIGTFLPLKFLEVNQEDNKLVVSNRKAVVEQQMTDLSRGDLVQGAVKALKPYGAFVEVGGMSGLLHISQISYDRIDDLEAVFQVGDMVKCMIIDHDKVNGRIALSTKTLENEPGDMIKDKAKVFEMAEETAAKYHERMEAERKAREEAAKDIVLGLGDSLDDLGMDDDDDSDDPLAEVSDDLDSVLG